MSISPAKLYGPSVITLPLYVYDISNSPVTPRLASTVKLPSHTPLQLLTSLVRFTCSQSAFDSLCIRCIRCWIYSNIRSCRSIIPLVCIGYSSCSISYSRCYVYLLSHTDTVYIRF